MKAIIRVVTANKEFQEHQLKILRRVVMVLIAHDLSACVEMKVKKTKKLKIPLPIKVMKIS